MKTLLRQLEAAKTTVLWLTPATTCYFRHQPVLQKGAAAEWSQTISIVVR